MRKKVLPFFLAVLCWTTVRADDAAGTTIPAPATSPSASRWVPATAKYLDPAGLASELMKTTGTESFVLSLSVRPADSNLMTTGKDNRLYVYIHPGGAMPEMRAYLIPDTLPGNVRYTLHITYDRSGRNDSHTYKETIPANGKWNINAAMGNHVLGGRAVLTCEYRNRTQSLTFYIRGVNPAKSEAEAYIRRICGLWYAGYVGIHESGSYSSNVMKQFNEKGEFNAGAADVRHTPNASADFGFGIFQLTKPVPSAQHLWSWKANCEEGVNRLVLAQDYADKWMRAQRQQMEDEGFSIPVPVKSFGKVRFEEGTSKTIEHAVALKKYNGSSGGNFCVWDDVHKYWKFNETNQLGFNYVERICKEVP